MAKKEFNTGFYFMHVGNIVDLVYVKKEKDSYSYFTLDGRIVHNLTNKELESYCLNEGGKSNIFPYLKKEKCDAEDRLKAAKDKIKTIDNFLEILEKIE